MIKNIVFDMGGVIIDFDPDRLLNEQFPSAEDRRIVWAAVFESGIWSDMMDRGTHTPEETALAICERLPERLHGGLMALFTLSMVERMPPFEDTYQLIKELKARGYKLYLLSNAPWEFYEKRHMIPAFAHMDGLAFSCQFKLIKPEPEIFGAFFEKFSLTPSECFFIDDMERNVEAARMAGMKTHLFRKHGVEAVLAQLTGGFHEQKN